MSVPPTPPSNGSEIVVRLTGDSTALFDWLVGIGPVVVAVVAIVIGYRQLRRTLASAADLEAWKWTIQQRRDLYARFLAQADAACRAASIVRGQLTAGSQLPGEEMLAALDKAAASSVLLNEVQLVGTDPFVAACMTLMLVMQACLDDAHARWRGDELAAGSEETDLTVPM